MSRFLRHPAQPVLDWTLGGLGAAMGIFLGFWFGVVLGLIVSMTYAHGGV